MKRDDDLIRELLLKYEAVDDWLLMLPAQSLSAKPEQRRELGHVLLMSDEGLVAEVSEGMFRLTSAGYDYLEAIRSDGIWSDTKAVIAETGGNATLEIVKRLAVGFLKKKIEQHTDIEL